MDEPNVLLANVPAFGDAEKFKESGARLAKLWSKPASIPFARKKITLSDAKESDHYLVPFNQTEVWTVIRNKAESTDIEVVAAKFKPREEGMLRVVTISDTHEKEGSLAVEDVPEGDILIHAGDITYKGKPAAFARFREWMGRLPHKHKIVIAGNHDTTLDDSFKFNSNEEDVKLSKKEVVDVDEFQYLQEDTIEIEGYKFYGSPMQPVISTWAFQKERGKPLREHWQQIPQDTEILVTHGPPTGFGDLCKNGIRAGCFDLLREVQTRVKPLVHVFGHIHENNGATTDGQTLYVNASICNYFYRPENPVVVFDLPRKQG